jgi:hypothetical protein
VFLWWVLGYHDRGYNRDLRLFWEIPKNKERKQRGNGYGSGERYRVCYWIFCLRWIQIILLFGYNILQPRHHSSIEYYYCRLDLMECTEHFKHLQINIHIITLRYHQEAGLELYLFSELAKMSAAKIELPCTKHIIIAIITILTLLHRPLRPSNNNLISTTSRSKADSQAARSAPTPLAVSASAPPSQLI